MIQGPAEEMEEGELEDEDSSTGSNMASSVQKGGRQTVPNPLYTPAASDEVERKGKTHFEGMRNGILT
jgi:hypothetical protein